MYSSYSNVPLKSGCCEWNDSFARRKLTYSLINGPYPRRPSPDMPRFRLSIQPRFAIASRKVDGWPSCRTLWTVIKALNVCTSSARMGCLYGVFKCQPLTFKLQTPSQHSLRRLGTVQHPRKPGALFCNGEGSNGRTNTFMPAQKAPEDLWSHVYTMQLRTCLRFGAVSSILVAFRILIASSPSDL